MNILGIEKSSFIDYPNKIATVLFTGGCNFRCPYCHNRGLVFGEGTPLNLDEILAFLKGRKKFVDAVCITGGEPTLQPGLAGFMKQIKEEGFSVKLDTNGSHPEVVADLVEANLVDYVAMDIKGPVSLYTRVVGVPLRSELIQESIDFLKKDLVDYEFRTTIARETLTREEIFQMAQEIKGSKRYFLQNFHDSDGVIGGKKVFTPYPVHELKRIGDQIAPLFGSFKIR